MKFTFRLQSILGLREAEQQDALSVYAQAVQARTALEQAKATAQAELTALEADVAKRRSTGTFPANLQVTYMASVQSIQAHIAALIQKIATAETTEQTTLTAFLAAKANTDILVKLKEKQLEAHNREVAKAHEALVDDFIISRHKVQA